MPTSKTRQQNAPRIRWHDALEEETFADARKLVLDYMNGGMTDDRRRRLTAIVNNLQKIGKTDDGMLKIRESVTEMRKTRSDAETSVFVSTQLANLARTHNIGGFRAAIADIQKVEAPHHKKLVMRAKASFFPVQEALPAHTGVSRMMLRSLKELEEAMHHMEPKRSVLMSGYPDGTKEHVMFRGASANYSLWMENVRRLRKEAPSELEEPSGHGF